MEKSSFSPPDGGNKDTPDVDTLLNMLETPIHELVHFSDDWALPSINPPPPSPFSEASVVEGEYFAACYGLPIRGGPVVIVPSFAPATTTTSLAPSSSSSAASTMPAMSKEEPTSSPQPGPLKPISPVPPAPGVIPAMLPANIEEKCGYTTSDLEEAVVQGVEVERLAHVDADGKPRSKKALTYRERTSRPLGITGWSALGRYQRVPGVPLHLWIRKDRHPEVSASSTAPFIRAIPTLSSLLPATNVSIQQRLTYIECGWTGGAAPVNPCRALLPTVFDWEGSLLQNYDYKMMRLLYIKVLSMSKILFVRCISFRRTGLVSSVQDAEFGCHLRMLQLNTLLCVCLKEIPTVAFFLTIFPLQLISEKPKSCLCKLNILIFAFYFSFCQM